jgi:hypothetical protein
LPIANGQGKRMYSVGLSGEKWNSARPRGKAWFAFIKDVERGQAKRGIYESLVDIGVAVRAPVHPGRIELVLALIENPHAELISAEVMRSAMRLALWYLNERLRLNEIASTSRVVERRESPPIFRTAVRSKRRQYGRPCPTGNAALLPNQDRAEQ